MRMVLAGGLILSQILAAQGVIRARQGSGGAGLRASSGTFDIRVYVDGEVDLLVRGDQIGSEVFTGRPIRDAGSEFSRPLPRTELTRIEIEKRDGRGKVEMLEEPSRRNGYTARIRVEDRDGGEDRYHVRISWEGQESFTDRSRPNQPRFSIYRPRRGVYALPGTPLHSSNNNPQFYDNAIEGGFEFRGRVDGEVIFYIRGDRITAEVVQGQPVAVERFRFSQPLPDRALRGFNLSKRDGRANVELLEEPSRENGWTSVIRIFDEDGGDDRYHFELTWRR
jgi:hypothetical protein